MYECDKNVQLNLYRHFNLATNLNQRAFPRPGSRADHIPLETSAATRKPSHGQLIMERKARGKRKSNTRQTGRQPDTPWFTENTQRSRPRREGHSAPDPQNSHPRAGGASGHFEVTQHGPMARMAEGHWNARWRADRVATGEAQVLPCVRDDVLLQEQIRIQESSSANRGSIASIIQQRISTAAGEGAGSSAAHAATPSSNPVVNSQQILGQFVPLVHGLGTHSGLVRHCDRKSSSVYLTVVFRF
jgi:hypothetical protein